MADSHSTPDTTATGTERTIIVGYRPNVHDKTTPNIMLSGKWLRAAGFETGQQVTVKVMDGCIVLGGVQRAGAAVAGRIKTGAGEVERD